MATESATNNKCWIISLFWYSIRQYWCIAIVKNWSQNLKWSRLGNFMNYFGKIITATLFLTHAHARTNYRVVFFILLKRRITVRRFLNPYLLSCCRAVLMCVNFVKTEFHHYLAVRLSLASSLHLHFLFKFKCKKS